MRSIFEATVKEIMYTSDSDGSIELHHRKIQSVEGLEIDRADETMELKILGHSLFIFAHWPFPPKGSWRTSEYTLASTLEKDALFHHDEANLYNNLLDVFDKIYELSGVSLNEVDVELPEKSSNPIAQKLSNAIQDSMAKQKRLTP